MVDHDEQEINIYKMNIKRRIDKKRIFICLSIVLLIICVILTGNYIARTVAEYKVYKQYEAQLNAIKQQEEEKQAKIAEEKERKRKERIPQLTDVRKAKYGEYISIKYKKSVFDI